MALGTVEEKRSEPKYPVYVSKANGGVHYPQTNAPGYEDRNPEIYEGARSLAEAQVAAVRYGAKMPTAAAAVDAMLDIAPPPPPPFPTAALPSVNDALGA